MSANSRPPVSSTTSQRNPPKIKKAPMVSNEARKPQLFKRHSAHTDSEKGKNEPLKPTAISLPIRSGEHSQSGGSNSSLTGSGSSKVNKRPPVKPKESAADLVNNAYDLYLQSYIMNGLSKIEVSRKSKRGERNLKIKLAKFTACQPKYQKKVWKIITIRLMEHLKHLKVVEGAFVNLVDFTGEETLVEMQSCLMAKYDKIRVEGKEVDEPLFQDLEIEILEELLKNHLLQCQEETKVAGFCKMFSQVLRKLKLKTTAIENDGHDQKRFNIELLEYLSMECSDLANKEKMNSTNKSGVIKVFDLNELLQRQPQAPESEEDDDEDEETAREDQCIIN